MTAPTLRHYQTEAVARIRIAASQGPRAILAVSPTGSGKTTIASHIAASAVSRGRRVLWLAHRSELVDQGFDRLREFGLGVGCISASSSRPPQPHVPVQVASIQTLLARNERPAADVVIWDECFVAGTDIDGRPIESIREGDTVDAFNERTGHIERRVVVRTMSRAPSALLAVHIAERRIICTPEHPFFTRRGWLPAKEIGNERVLVRSDDQQKSETMSRLLSSRNVGAQSQREDKASDARAQSNVGPIGARKDGEHSYADRAQAHDAWRKRQAADASGDGTGNTSRTRAEGLSDRDRLAPQDEGRDACLQGRPCDPIEEDRNRGGRRVALRETPAFGSEEGRDLVWARVDRVEVLERTGDGTFGGMCPDGRVYNLEVDGLHTYIANGVVVHNCHHSVSDEWSALAKHYQQATLIGFTATPERSDGKGLGAIFTRIVVVARVRELVDLWRSDPTQGLVPCEIVRPADRLKAGSIAQRPVDAYLTHASGRKAICFSPSVKAAELHAEEFNGLDIGARVVTGKTPRPERDLYMAAFKSGRIQVLVNVYVATEGFDVPDTSAVILARGCGTAGTYIQMTGRGARPAPGKRDYVLIDLHGVSHVHGHPEDDREYSLDGKGIRRGTDLEVDETPSCRVCGAPITAGEACAECGTQPKEIEPPKVTGDPLVKYAAKRAESDEKRVATAARWIADAASNGYKPGFWKAKYKAVYGEWPPYTIEQAARSLLNSEKVA